ncbi:ArsR/SmtB family transcription factor [Lentilactobacillus hilgardii]|uniref:ArsR/SmtB family transcription factor n=1 Tax=Lentilactobacillus hilgardii TaxID=1588 RepID=UPI0021C45872|nr:metalloregulator ArsR/SmtB family transcription factor [Lentilactobacillus hilgardii]MCP9334016.1 helix-turn-helix transcriptional regulator [Lentilactobacillus hilgardii]MCP9350635.1 helix-turn-helix transcriptional regulator [Lentilactobacillus hilgardii]MCP9353182.1 helix-turn-helix transcriptional regulator [Lentilactobacillus hilgardii]
MSKLSMKLFKESMPYFTIFQDENRQKIVNMLCNQKKMTVTEITTKSDLSRPAVSHHLKLMLDANVLGVEKRGTERLYYLKLKKIIQLLRKLADSLENSSQLP